MKNVVTRRFVACHNYLKKEKKIKSSRQFALSLDYLPQSLSEILKGRRDVTIEILRKGVEIYGMNPHFLLTGEGSLFLDKRSGEARPSEFGQSEGASPFAFKGSMMASNRGDFSREYGQRSPGMTINPGLYCFQIKKEAGGFLSRFGDLVLCSPLQPESFDQDKLEGALIGKKKGTQLEVFAVEEYQEAESQFRLNAGNGSEGLRIGKNDLEASFYLIHSFLHLKEKCQAE